MTKRGITTLALGAAVGILALVGVAASATHYLQEPYNPGFLRFPTVVALHVVLGGVYLALAPFQFVKRIRSRHLAYHRRIGRLLVAIGVVVAATALFMGLAIPKAGWPERVVIGLFGTVFFVALVKGFVHVRAGRVVPHREWMIRAFAVGLAIATARLIFYPALLITTTDPTDRRFGTLLAVALAVAFVLHVSVAERWICATRRSSAPGQSMKPSSWYPRPGFSEDLGHEEGSKRWMASLLVLVVRGESDGLDSSFSLEKRKSCLASCRPDVDFGLRHSCRG